MCAVWVMLLLHALKSSAADTHKMSLFSPAHCEWQLTPSKCHVNFSFLFIPCSGDVCQQISALNRGQAICAMTISCFPKDQNGDSHHVGDLKISGKEFLSLPARSKKYREHQPTSERRPQGSSTSPLDASEVRVQVSQSVGRCFFSSGTHLGALFLTWWGGGSVACWLESRACV